MACRSLIVAVSILVPTLAFAQPAPKRAACKTDTFAGCAATHKALNARAEIADISRTESYGDANSMYGFNSAAGNGNGRTGGGGGAGGGGGE